MISKFIRLDAYRLWMRLIQACFLRAEPSGWTEAVLSEGIRGLLQKDRPRERSAPSFTFNQNGPR
jgi:hypothetical protein